MEAKEWATVLKEVYFKRGKQEVLYFWDLFFLIEISYKKTAFLSYIKPHL